MKLNLIVLSLAAAFFGRPAALCTANAEEESPAPTDNSPLALMARGAGVDPEDVRWRVQAGLDIDQAVQAAVQQKASREAEEALKKKTKKSDKGQAGNALTSLLLALVLILGLAAWLTPTIAHAAAAAPSFVQLAEASAIDTVAAPLAVVAPAMRWRGLCVILLAAGAGALFLARSRNGQRRDLCATANAETAAGTHRVLTYRADAAHSSRHLLVRAGSDGQHAAVCGAGNYPIGSTTDAPDGAEGLLNVQPLGSSEYTRVLRSASALNADVDVYTAANGFIQGEPGSAGTYYRVGRTVAASVQEGSSNYLTEIAPCQPIKLVVAATPSTVGNIAAALATPTLVKFL